MVVDTDIDEAAQYRVLEDGTREIAINPTKMQSDYQNTLGNVFASDGTLIYSAIGDTPADHFKDYMDFIVRHETIHAAYEMPKGMPVKYYEDSINTLARIRKTVHADFFNSFLNVKTKNKILSGDTLSKLEGSPGFE